MFPIYKCVYSSPTCCTFSNAAKSQNTHTENPGMGEETGNELL